MKLLHQCPECSKKLSFYRHYLILMGSTRVTCNHCDCNFLIYVEDKYFYYLIISFSFSFSMLASLNFKIGNYLIGFGFVFLLIVSIWLYATQVTSVLKIKEFFLPENKYYRKLIIVLAIVGYCLFIFKKATRVFQYEKPDVLIANSLS